MMAARTWMRSSSTLLLLAVSLSMLLLLWLGCAPNGVAGGSGAGSGRSTYTHSYSLTEQIKDVQPNDHQVCGVSRDVLLDDKEEEDQKDVAPSRPSCPMPVPYFSGRGGAANDEGSPQPSMAPSNNRYHSRDSSTALLDEFPTEDVPTNAQPSPSSSAGGSSSSDSSSDSEAEEEESPSSSSTTSSTSSSSGDDINNEYEDEDSLLASFSPRKHTQRQLKALREKRQQFLDHIAMISTSFLKKEPNAKVLSDSRSTSMDDESQSNSTRHSSVSTVSEEQQQQQSPQSEHHDDDAITPQTDLTLPGRHFHIVTTAALPWMTGTAVNPLLRAAYLHRRTQRINSNKNNSRRSSASANQNYNLSTQSTTMSQQQQQQQRWVTLVIPWLELEEDQRELYQGQVFGSMQEQEDYIRDWLAHSAGMPDAADPHTGLQLLFYPARYHAGLRSIFAMGDICRLISNSNSSQQPSKTDVCILEEPEHCNWFRAPGDGWTQTFHYVVGIVHTNYKEYASAHYSGLWTAPAIAMVSSAMVRAYCHQVIKLSDVLQTFAPEKEATSNVHGVRSDFLDIGLERAQKQQQQQKQKQQKRKKKKTKRGSNNSTTEHLGSDDEPDTALAADNANTTTVYFIGKLLWAKGLDLLLDLQDYYKQCTGHYFAIDIYGSGPEQKAIRRAYWGRKLNSNTNATHPQHSHSKHHHHHKKRHHHTRHRYYRDKVNATKIFTSTAAFKEHLRKFKESLPTADDYWRNLKESIQSTEFPTNLAEFRKQPIPATFPGRVDHASLGRHAHYKVFVNPSISEVLCTTTAEALAMGKFAIIPVHPSNTFFLRFPNCLAYRNKFEFAANLEWALTHEPEPLTPELAHEFTWEAATDRFIQASAVTWKEAREREKRGFSKRDERIAWFHNQLGKGSKGDILRMVLGGGPASAQVKYVLEQEEKWLADNDGGEEDEETSLADDGDESDIDEDEGLTRKFRRSSFVQALHATVANGLPSSIGGWDREDEATEGT